MYSCIITIQGTLSGSVYIAVCVLLCSCRRYLVFLFMYLNFLCWLSIWLLQLLNQHVKIESNYHSQFFSVSFCYVTSR